MLKNFNDLLLFVRFMLLSVFFLLGFGFSIVRMGDTIGGGLLYYISFFSSCFFYAAFFIFCCSLFKETKSVLQKAALLVFMLGSLLLFLTYDLPAIVSLLEGVGVI